MVIDQRLISYVKESLDRGFSPEQIKSLLLGYGYSPAVIEEMFSAAQQSSHWKTIYFIIAVAGVIVILIGGLYFFMPAKEESPAEKAISTEAEKAVSISETVGITSDEKAVLHAHYAAVAKKDIIALLDTTYQSDSFKKSFPPELPYTQMLSGNLLVAPQNEVTDIQVIEKKVIGKYNFYRYKVYYKASVPGVEISPEEDASFLIKTPNGWKIDPEPEMFGIELEGEVQCMRGELQDIGFPRPVCQPAANEPTTTESVIFEGEVADEKTRRPIPGATVVIFSERCFFDSCVDSRSVGASDANGNVNIAVTTPLGAWQYGSEEILVFKEGYQTYSAELTELLSEQRFELKPYDQPEQLFENLQGLNKAYKFCAVGPGYGEPVSAKLQPQQLPFCKLINDMAFCQKAPSNVAKTCKFWTPRYLRDTSLCTADDLNCLLQISQSTESAEECFAMKNVLGRDYCFRYHTRISKKSEYCENIQDLQIKNDCLSEIKSS